MGISELVKSAHFCPLLIPAIWQEEQGIDFDDFDFDKEEIEEMETEQENR